MMYPEQLPSRAFATVSFAVDWAYLRDLNLLCHRVDGDLETVVRRALSDYVQAVSMPAVDVVRIRRRRRWGLLLAGVAGVALGVAGTLLAVVIR
ncbi:hypothetical protein [Actinoplanes sp. NPDC051411]|uniref:hypothetical protein n=1 Tax=Actinoplanes sp. NPDC051411 TaxID=3155522 RepID=UPI00341783C5